MRQRRFLIMTASIGSGHIRAAEAVEGELRKQCPEADIRTVDFMSHKTSVFHGLLKDLYLRMLDFVPNLYDLFYKVSGGGSGGTLAQTMFAAVTCRTMCRIVEEYRPDAPICTHPFPEGAAALARRLGRRDDFLLAAVLTDYSLHQIWIYPRVDLYFTATEEMRAGLLKRGFLPGQVFAPGIAVQGNIGEVSSREDARRDLGLDGEGKTLLLMGGGLGLGGIEESLKDIEGIEANLTLLVVAGRNEDLRQKLEGFGRASHHRVRVWGYTDRVYELMAASDLLITKPGALTMSEAFVMGLPMVLREPIPGPEAQNAVYASERGAAVWVHHGESVGQVLAALLSDEGKLRSMAACALSCARPHAARDIVGILSSILAENKT